jgi:hypothetical protein
MWLLEQYLELVSVFKEASRNFVFIFLFNKAGYGRLKICAYFMGLQTKIFIW